MNSVEISSLEKRIADLERRLSILENKKIRSDQANFKDKSEQDEHSKYKGLTGGITFLVDSGFFNTLHSSREIHEELKKEGYVYRVEAVDTILRRDFVFRKKILSRTREDNIWKYGLRK